MTNVLRRPAALGVTLLLMGGCSGDDGTPEERTTTTEAGSSGGGGTTTTEAGSSGGGTTTTVAGSGGSVAGPLPDACTLLTRGRAERVLGPGNERVFVVESPGEPERCLYNSLVTGDGSLNGGNLDLSFAEAALPSPPEDADRLDLGDESYLEASEDVLRVYVKLGSTLMTLFVQTSSNNPRLTVASARDPLVAVAREIVASL